MASSPPEPLSAEKDRDLPQGESAQIKTKVLDHRISREVEAMAAAWKRGERLPAEDVLASYPGLDEELAVRIVYEEACLRMEAGEDSVSSEILGRFPQWRSKLELLFEGNRLLRAPAHANFPVVGENLGEFRLLAELGKGAAGRTYLARQSSLANRPVVLKTTPLGHDEHLSLARLQHMAIVPLYFEQVIPDRSLRALCMPYLGGTTLARVLYSLSDVPLEQRTGRQILEAIDRLGVVVPEDEPPHGPTRKYLAQATYTQAVCWIGACLAEALQYAHDRGLVHMDVKPSNVLLTADGQPMLLDFHLARGPVHRGDAKGGRFGGTPRYMSPEQREAMAAARLGLAIERDVDGRTDIFSLGLVLYEALGGVPFSSAPLSSSSGRGKSKSSGNRDRELSKPPLSCAVSLERCNAKVSPGLSDLVRRCLARDPEGRYRDAGSLAADLRRHLNDLPLRGVANRSLAERWRKWRRRRPLDLPKRAFGIVAITAIIWATAAWITHTPESFKRIDAALTEANEARARHRYDDAMSVLERGLWFASSLPAHDPRRVKLATMLIDTRREKTAAELHELVDLLRFRSGLNVASRQEASSLLQRALELWGRRTIVALATNPSADEESRDQLRGDLLDLATICASLHIEAARGGESETAIREAVEILREAEREYGTSPALARDLRTYATQLGDELDAPEKVPEPRTAWDHFDLGRSYLRSGDNARAEAEFRQSVDLQPDQFWPNFYQGVAASRLGRHQEAVSALSICVALAPRTAECYYNRAVALEALDEKDRALADYAKALEFKPTLIDAAVNRAILLSGKSEYAAATRELERALAVARSGSDRGRVLYNLGIVRIAEKDRAGALARLREAAESGNEDARTLLSRLRAD